MAQVAGARQLLRVVNLSSPPLCYPILLSENGSLTLLPLARMSWESFIGWSLSCIGHQGVTGYLGPRGQHG